MIQKFLLEQGYKAEFPREWQKSSSSLIHSSKTIQYFIFSELIEDSFKHKFGLLALTLKTPSQSYICNFKELQLASAGASGAH